jgi:pilus assembly protein Flp/PilA
MKRSCLSFHLLRLRCEHGVAAIEYGLIAALIALAIVQGAARLGGGSNGLLTNVDQQTSTAMASAGGGNGKALGKGHAKGDPPGKGLTK